MIWAFVLCFIIVGGDDHCICIVFYNCRREMIQAFVLCFIIVGGDDPGIRIVFYN